MSSCSSSSFCCPVPCDKNFFPEQPIIGIKRCLPVKSVCDGTMVTTIYSAPAHIPDSALASGFISLTNTSRDCTMELTVTDDGGPMMYNLLANGDSIVVEVSQLSLCTIVCTGTNVMDFCTGTFEIDLQYRSFV
ncbi:S-Ena type endospore appendage [Cytobacillus sp. IB215665]|uniref:S-Ena type endospore appendage n=1 Tax=Cytobacillus sp. IB215665 TaxID=3097357 RepID=UPI002A0F87BF|nr:S-Ena type endospore appendage [Cytobacillus sp. IB215665]MDX8365794.1 S-Ena type endospore appendage [Cytobacillus sp. IB215665]